jgi:hypothetical protein
MWFRVERNEPMVVGLQSLPLYMDNYDHFVVAGE